MQLLIIGLISLIGGFIALAIKEFGLSNPKILMNKNSEERNRAMYLLATSIILFILGAITIIQWFLDKD